MTALRHLTDVASLPEETFRRLLSRSLTIREMMDRGSFPAPVLDRRALVNLFFEDSTRTLMSFEMAAKRLGAHTLTLPIANSSVKKGESLEDTVLTMCAQGADYLVIRARDQGTIARAIDVIEQEGFLASVLNAGEGSFGHPTQGLLDAATMLRAIDRTPDQGLTGYKLAICGDVSHSRVAASTIEASARLGAEIVLGGPVALLPDAPPPGVQAMTSSVAEAVSGADFVMTLRLQKERMTKALDLSLEEYHRQYGLRHEVIAAANPGAFILHPGPANRNVEITDALADDPARSLIRSQVRQGVALRMALLEEIERGKSR